MHPRFICARPSREELIAGVLGTEIFRHYMVEEHFAEFAVLEVELLTAERIELKIPSEKKIRV